MKEGDVKYVPIGRKMFAFVINGGQFLGKATFRETLQEMRREKGGLKSIRVNPGFEEIHSQQDGLPV